MNAHNNSAECHALLVTAHCDDAELWAGGTLARWADEGLQCTVGIIFHDAERREETRRSAEMLKYRAVFLDDRNDQVTWIISLLEISSPKVLLTHPDNDPHPDHRATHHQTISALTKFKNRRAVPLRWYTFDSYYQTRLPAAWPMAVNIGATLERKLAALAEHRSQDTAALTHQARHNAAMTGMRVRMEHAEAFYPFDLLGRWPVLRDLP